MKKAIGYIRVSTEEQSGDDKFGIDVQRQAIEKYANSNGYEIVQWCEDVISGAKDNRPELDKILYMPEELPSHDAVIVFKNDRLARDTKLYFYYFYTLEKQNVKLLSTEEHFVEGDEFTNIYRSLLMFVAEQERKNIALRTGKGRMAKAHAGGYAGGNKPYGYKVVDGRLVINESEAVVVRDIFKMREQYEMTFADIADRLYDMGIKTRNGKRFQPASVRSIVGNRKTYEGYYHYGKQEWVKGIQEAILEAV